MILLVYAIGVVGTFIAAITWGHDHPTEEFGVVSSLLIALVWPVFLVAGVMRKLMQG